KTMLGWIGLAGAVKAVDAGRIRHTFARVGDECVIFQAAVWCKPPKGRLGLVTVPRCSRLLGRKIECAVAEDGAKVSRKPAIAVGAGISDRAQRAGDVYLQIVGAVVRQSWIVGFCANDMRNEH